QGNVQPTRDEIVAHRGVAARVPNVLGFPSQHFNGITSWAIDAKGEVRHVYASGAPSARFRLRSGVRRRPEPRDADLARGARGQGYLRAGRRHGAAARRRRVRSWRADLGDDV